MAPEARNMFGAPMFQLHCSSFGSKFAVLEKLLATLFALFGARGIVPHLVPSLRPCRCFLAVYISKPERNFAKKAECKWYPLKRLCISLGVQEELLLRKGFLQTRNQGGN